MNYVRCNQSEHELLADGLDAQGRQLSKLSGEYPPLFCGFFGFIFNHPNDPWDARDAAADTPESRQLLRVIEAQRALMDGGAAAQHSAEPTPPAAVAVAPSRSASPLLHASRSGVRPETRRASTFAPNSTSSATIVALRAR